MSNHKPSFDDLHIGWQERLLELQSLYSHFETKYVEARVAINRLKAEMADLKSELEALKEGSK